MKMTRQEQLENAYCLLFLFSLNYMRTIHEVDQQRAKLVAAEILTSHSHLLDQYQECPKRVEASLKKIIKKNVG